MNIQEKQAAWLKQQKSEEDAAFKTFKNRIDTQAQTVKENARLVKEQQKVDKKFKKWKKKNPEPIIPVRCDFCGTVFNVKGYVANLIGKEEVCPSCSAVLTIYFPQANEQQRINMEDEIRRKYAQDREAAEEARTNFWLTIGGLALGCYLGNKLGHKLYEDGKQ